MAYGEALGTVGESTKFSCANRHLPDECAFTDRGSFTPTRIMRFRPSGTNTRIPDGLAIEAAKSLLHKSS
jgi:hypothetical protein